MNDRKIAGVKVFVSNETYDEYKGTLQEQINNLQSKIDKAIEFVEEYKKQWVENDEVVNDMNNLENILKEDK